VKALAFMPRRPDLGRAAFREYYETRHAPLALRYLEFERYVRNHVIGGAEVGFDCISEFWPRRLEATAALMRTKVGERMRADEREFADQPRLVSSGCEEILLAGAPRGDDESGLRKLALFLRTGLDAAGLERALRAATETLPVAPLRVTLDRVFGGWPAPAPCDAILWMHGVAEPVDVALPSEVALVGRVVTDTAETAAADLAVAGRGTLE
jgi:uncharacterized protein (TIGR02118 family)